MEPTRDGEHTVWQQWVQNNWEVMLHTNTSLVQITDSIEHDIAPHIRGDLVIWNVRSSDGTQSLMTYDIGSDTYNEIHDTDGVSVTNPRMLVMYEAQYQNGDTVMKGFDIITGEVIPINNIPREVPKDIPSPEPTGEVRALPTYNQIEEDIASDTDIDTDDPDQNSSKISKHDLDLSSTNTTTSTTTDDVTKEYDLDLSSIEHQTASSTTNDVLIEQAAIPDTIVPSVTEEGKERQASSTQQI
jgi:hypothetical protein